MLPLILSLKLEAESFKIFDEMRRRYFPPAINFINAHVTIFHKLPAERENEIRASLRTFASQIDVLPLRFSAVRFLGKGVAIEINSPELISVRGKLLQMWKDSLAAQDLQKFRPHITIQNKVSPEKARKLNDELSASWQPFDSTGEGLQLWQYLGGPWRLIEEFDFTLRSPHPVDSSTN